MIAPSGRDQQSNQYRTVENVNLGIAIRQTMPLGTGFGHPIPQAVPNVDISNIDSFISYLPHNGVLYLWLRLGLLGIVAFWSMIGIAVMTAITTMRRQKREIATLITLTVLAAIVAYVASLAPGPRIPTPQPARGNLAAGQEQFTEHCAGCHQIVAEGGYVTNAVAPPLKHAGPVEIAEAVRTGPYLMPRFSAQQITDAQLDTIIRYVIYAKHPDDRGGWALGHLGPVPEGLVTWFVGIVLLVATCLVIGRRLHS